MFVFVPTYTEVGIKDLAWVVPWSTSIAPCSAWVSLFSGTESKMNRQTLVHFHQGALLSKSQLGCIPGNNPLLRVQNIPEQGK